MPEVQVEPQSLVIRYFGVSISYLILSVTLGVLMFLGIFPDRGFQAHVHMALLGFVSLAIMGALYQIVPTILGVGLYNPRFAGVQFWLMNIGVFGLTASFFMGGTFITLPAILTAIASYIFVYIILATNWNSKAPLNITMKFFLSALVYFSVAIAIGVALASLKPSQVALFYKGNYLVSHVHLALLGFVGLTIMGAMYQMLPMLSLRELHSPWLGEVQFWLMNIGIVGFSIGMLSGMKDLLAFFAIVAVAAVYLFVYNMYRTLAKKGGKFDISVKFFASALVYLTIACTLGVLIALFHKELLGVRGLLSAHAHLTSTGFISLTIMGAMYHLVPMLVWMTRYSEKLGKEPVPSIAEMYDQRMAHLQFASATLGVAGYFLGLLMSNSLAMLSAMVFLASTYLFAYIMYNVITPWRK
ncbi:MAG: cbb3-type cytochrome c oxidase subunit I [Candidatus Hydrothermarchaeaceae archaeon]